MFELLKSLLEKLFRFLFGAAADIDAGYRRKLLRRFCNAVDEKNWAEANRVHYKLYKKPYEVPKDRR